jgi:hypothetical protein
MLFDGDGDRMTLTHAVKKGTRYRYYETGTIPSGSSQIPLHLCVPPLAFAGSPRRLATTNPSETRGRTPLCQAHLLGSRGGFRRSRG